MNQIISIGKQDFASLRENNYFFIDKSKLIKEWWESGDDITLIARPRRFGKTLNMSMLNCFFSRRYADRSDLFDGLSVWNDENYRELQGAYPVIFLSFADVKQTNSQEAIYKIKKIIAAVYQQFTEVGQSDRLTGLQKKQFMQVTPEMDDVTAQSALQDLSYYCYLHYGKKAIILLDEYDTPMQEAYIHGEWKMFTAFVRGLFNSTFKTNPYLERAMMTGVTRVSKASIFSDLNNLVIITTTSERYADCFGFTESEVFQALDAFDLGDDKEDVKKWYDGFIFGSQQDIYNPWSITNFLKERQFRPYWAATSSNQLINRMIQTSSVAIKTRMETLLDGEQIVVNLDEQIVYEQLDQDENAIWSLMLASGYLKASQVEYRGDMLEPWYHLSITNLETVSMFSAMFRGWFGMTQSNYQGFMKALITNDIEAMNHYLNEVMAVTFSYFDTGKNDTETEEPERFYHGFILGLIVEQRETYQIRSNRESGFGRYDVMMIPKQDYRNKMPAIIMEFKVHNSRKEKTLEETVQSALQQIKNKQYDTELIAQGIHKTQIRYYGFAFEGKKVLIEGVE